MLADNNCVCVVKVRLLDAVHGEFLLLLEQMIGSQKKHIDADGAACAKLCLMRFLLLDHLQRMIALILFVDSRTAALACRLCQGSALHFLLHAHGLC